MPTSVFFIPPAPGAAGWELVERGWASIEPTELAGGFVLAEPAGGGVEPCGATPTRVFFMSGADRGAAGIEPDDGRGGAGRTEAPHTPHVGVSSFAGDPQRGQTFMLRDYFPCSQNAMA